MDKYLGYNIEMWNGYNLEYEGKVTKAFIKLLDGKKGTLQINKSKKDIILTLEREPDFKNYCDLLYWRATGIKRESIFNGNGCIIGYKEIV